MPGSIEKAWPGTSFRRVSRDDVRILVLLKADSVPGTVEEAGPLPCRVDHGAGGGINRFAAHPWANMVHRRLVGALQDLVAAQEVIRWRHRAIRPGHPNGSGGVGTIATKNATDVEHDRIARVDHPRRCFVVW